METSGWLIKYDEGVCVTFYPQGAGEFQSLAFTAGKGTDGLSQSEIIESNITEW
jgi:hypothetical protein